MGALTLFLQDEFARRCPTGWVCRPEVRLLPRELERLLGYASRADVVLERPDGSRRLWIEFEVSRADPVANHAKFATAHLFHPLPPTDSFVAMVSAHVDRGRRNLAANTVLLMRHLGMSAFQTVLSPRVPAEEIQRLNHLDRRALSAEQLLVEPEIERALCVSEAVMVAQGQRIHFAGDISEVMLNLRQWNRDLATPGGRALWEKRTITYFVFDPRSGDFAPSKCCAFVTVPTGIEIGRALRGHPITTAMAIGAYATLGGEQIFDRSRAHRHLTRRLGMVSLVPAEVPDITSQFSRWLARHAEHVNVHPNGPVIIGPPAWFS